MAMTIRQCMDAAYQLLNEYSIAGATVPLSYNGQADMENRMINLINAAQMEIAATVKPIDMDFEYVVDNTNVNTGWQRVEMPEDFDRFVGVKFMGPRGQFIQQANYRMTETSILYLPTDSKGTFIIEYYRFPVRYEPDVDKSTELDNKPDTHEVIPYYIASTLCIDDNSYAYAALHNLYELKLARLNNKPARAEAGVVDDVYGWDRFGGVW